VRRALAALGVAERGCLSPGDSLIMYIIDRQGMAALHLGSNVPAGDSFVVPIPHGVWFGAVLHPEGKAGWALMGLSSAPGFESTDSESVSPQVLAGAFPAYAEIILTIGR